jgi:hypothetical protein
LLNERKMVVLHTIEKEGFFLYISHSTNGRCVTEEEPEGFNKGRQCYQTTGLKSCNLI